MLRKKTFIKQPSSSVNFGVCSVETKPAMDGLRR